MTEVDYQGRKIGFRWLKCWGGHIDQHAVVCDVYVDGHIVIDVRYGNSHIPPSQQEKLGADAVKIPLQEFRKLLTQTRPPESEMPTGTF